MCSDSPGLFDRLMGLRGWRWWLAWPPILLAVMGAMMAVPLLLVWLRTPNVEQFARALLADGPPPAVAEQVEDCVADEYCRFALSLQVEDFCGSDDFGMDDRLKVLRFTEQEPASLWTADFWPTRELSLLEAGLTACRTY